METFLKHNYSVIVGITIIKQLKQLNFVHNIVLHQKMKEKKANNVCEV